MRWNDRIGRRIKLSDLHVSCRWRNPGAWQRRQPNLRCLIRQSRARSATWSRFSACVFWSEIRTASCLPNSGGPCSIAAMPRSTSCDRPSRISNFSPIQVSGRCGSGVPRHLPRASSRPLSIGSTVAYPRIAFHVVSANVDVLRRELDERTVDLLIVREIGSFSESVSFEVLYDNPYFVSCRRRESLVARRVVQLADLVNESWVLPPPGSRLGMLVRDIFDAAKLPFPQAAVLSYGLEMIVNLAWNRPIPGYPTGVSSYVSSQASPD